ncbi:hypothetical protein, conserved [Eimeria brunetti]|uniref:Uncharacterized protein n=1 Tax=Eimeria brunetti TaxID=51314 RepID=U6LLZ0_9EIME|nr:hypothetical protein, conserved [Eimeria brunetti]
MLLGIAVAAATCLSALLPERSGAAYSEGNGFSSSSTHSTVVEVAPPEHMPPKPLVTTSPSIRPALKFALAVSACTALFLLLRCIQSRTSSSGEANKASKSFFADKDKEGDGCDRLAKAMTVSSGESDDEDLDDIGFVGMDGFHTGEVYEFKGDPSIPPPFSDFPEADPPTTRSKAEVEEAVAVMRRTLDWIRAGEVTGSEEASGGHSLVKLLDDCYYLRQKHKNAEFGPDVPGDLATKFKELVEQVEEQVSAYYAIGVWVCFH